MTHIIPGHCVSCDEPCHEGIDRYPRDHPRKNDVCRVGLMRDTAQNVDFLLSNGSIISFLFCNKCASALKPEDYPSIMRRNLDSYAWELSDEFAEIAKLGGENVPSRKEGRIRDFWRHHANLWIVGRLWGRREVYRCAKTKEKVPMSASLAKKVRANGPERASPNDAALVGEMEVVG